MHIRCRNFRLINIYVCVCTYEMSICSSRCTINLGYTGYGFTSGNYTPYKIRDYS